MIDVLLYEEKPTVIVKKDWKRLQMQAVSMIYLYLMDHMVIHVLSETFPTMMWSKLEEMYMVKTLTNALFL